MDLENQIKELSERNQKLQNDLAEIQNAMESNAQAVDQLNKSLMSQGEASKMHVSKIGNRIEALQAELDQKRGELRKQQAEDLESLNTTTKALLTAELGKSEESINQVQTEISKLQTDIKDLKEDTGEWEKPGKPKRRFAILAAVAGGIAWFAVNSLGSSD